MAVYRTQDTELESIAEAIRTKTGNSGSLIYPAGFVNAINGIASDCNATAGDILSGKIGFTANGKVTGTIASKEATVYYVKDSAQTIAAKQYLKGAQTIKGVYTENIEASNIKEGVFIKVGDSNSDTRIKNEEGTCIPASLPTQSFMPFMWKNGGTQIPAFTSHQDTSSSYKAQKTKGYRIYWRADQSQGNHDFVLPCNITFTYFKSDTSSSTHVVTLNGGTVYNCFQYDKNDATLGRIRNNDDTTVTNIYKIVSWAVADKA